MESLLYLLRIDGHWRDSRRELGVGRESWLLARQGRENVVELRAHRSVTETESQMRPDHQA